MNGSVSRKQYQADYYQKHKEQKKRNYNAQTQYLKWVDIKKKLFSLKRRIGSDAYNLIMDELRELEVTKH